MRVAKSAGMGTPHAQLRRCINDSTLRIGFLGGCMYDQNLQGKVGIWFGEGESFRYVKLHMPKETYEAKLSL
jgi:hypothetical protein